MVVTIPLSNRIHQHSEPTETGTLKRVKHQPRLADFTRSNFSVTIEPRVMFTVLHHTD